MAIRRPRLVLLATAVATLISAPGAPAAVHERSDLEAYFAAAATTGTMVVREDGPRPQTTVIGADRSRQRYLPSSTFNIPNALLAIDRGVVSGAGQPFPGPNENSSSAACRSWRRHARATSRWRPRSPNPASRSTSGSHGKSVAPPTGRRFARWTTATAMSPARRARDDGRLAR